MLLPPPIVIFDLDGTLTDATHRQWMIQGKDKDWRRFYAASKDDDPKLPVHAILKALHTAEHEIWVWSGRSDEVRAQTFGWLAQYGLLQLITFFRMRRAGDYTPDDKLKMSWYDDMLVQDRERLLLTFDDRNRMVAAWRSRGITCCQVAPGNF